MTGMAENYCPQCEDEGRPATPIGHARSACALCNRYAQRVRRAAQLTLATRHPDDWARAREEAETTLYPPTVEEYLHASPAQPRNRSTVSAR